MMIDAGSRTQYDAVAVTFHWTLTAAILVALPLGFLAAHANGSQTATSFLQIHVPLGILIVILTAARAVWRFRHSPPLGPLGQPEWQVRTARLSHALLYFIPVVLGVSGLGLLALSGLAPVLFDHGVGALPDLSRLPPFTVHAVAGFALVGVLCLHLAAVAYHQFVRRNRLLARIGVGRSSESPR